MNRWLLQKGRARTAWTTHLLEAKVADVDAERLQEHKRVPNHAHA
jgi:hypothetical protein